jgi:hypothetical protein
LNATKQQRGEEKEETNNFFFFLSFLKIYADSEEVEEASSGNFLFFLSFFLSSVRYNICRKAGANRRGTLYSG